jgi:hypothetical protein
MLPCRGKNRLVPFAYYLSLKKKGGAFITTQAVIYIERLRKVYGDIIASDTLLGGGG